MNKLKSFCKFNRFNGFAVKPDRRDEHDKKRDRRGFTLGELLITVAILSIVVAIAVPIFNSHRDDAKESVCLTNRTAFKQALTIQQIMHKNNPSWAVTGLQSYFDAHKEEYKCPSGGTYTLKLPDDMNLVVECSLHGAATVDKIMVDVLNGITWTNTNRVDGKNESGPTRNNVMLELEKLNVDLDGNFGVKIWTAAKDANGNLLFVWSTYDPINTYVTPNEQWKRIPAICYDDKTKKYIVGMSNIAWKTSSTPNYYSLATDIEGGGGFNPAVKKECATYEEALKEYNRLKPSKIDDLSKYRVESGFEQYIADCGPHYYGEKQS